MSPILLTLLVGVSNLFLGYLVAVRLGYGPPSLLDTWGVLVADRPTRGGSSGQPGALGQSRDRLMQTVISGPLDEILNPVTEHGDELYEESDDALEEEAPAQPAPQEPEVWDLSEKFVETSVLKLNAAMIKSGAKATDIDARLRAALGRSDGTTVQTCLVELLEDCQAYLTEQSEVTQSFRDRVDELGSLTALANEIEMANVEQAAQIEAVISSLKRLDWESDPEAATRRLLEELKSLRVARHKLRDDREIAFLTIARHENRMDQIDKPLLDDPLTKLPSRIGLEATLWQWWQEDRQRSCQMCGVLFDLDRFGQVNDEHGPRLADRILYELAQVILKTAGEGVLVGRFAGQRFLMMTPDMPPGAATEQAEAIRQSIERMTFLHGDEEIRLTTSASVSEVMPDDTPEGLFERLEQAVQQAKQAGPNRSAFHGGEKAALVEVMNLRAAYSEIPIERLY